MNWNPLFLNPLLRSRNISYSEPKMRDSSVRAGLAYRNNRREKARLKVLVAEIFEVGCDLEISTAHELDHTL